MFYQAVFFPDFTLSLAAHDDHRLEHVLDPCQENRQVAVIDFIVLAGGGSRKTLSDIVGGNRAGGGGRRLLGQKFRWCPGRLKVGPGFAFTSRAVPSRRAGALRCWRRRRRSASPSAPPPPSTRRFRYARRHRARQEPRGSRGPIVRERESRFSAGSVLRCSSLR